MQNRPLISIIVPAYNVEQYVAETIESILNQKHARHVEIIVVDDNSNDETFSVVQKYAETYQNIKLISNVSNKSGASGARNAGIRVATGAWLWFLDADDVLEPNVLDSFFSVLRVFPNEKFFSYNFFYWHGSEKILQTDRNENWKAILADSFNNKEFCVVKKPLEVFLRHSVLTGIGAGIVHHSIVAAVGDFDEDLTVCEDWFFWFHVALEAKVMVFVPEVAMSYRTRAGSLTRRGIPTSVWDVAAYRKLYKSKKFSQYKSLVRAQVLRCVVANVYFFRKEQIRVAALRASLEWVYLAPLQRSAWWSLAASLLRM